MTAIAAIEPGSLRAWVAALRPATLTAALTPVLVGAAVARAAGDVRLGALFAAAVGAILIQIGTNLANDLFDHEKGADTKDRLGPVRVTSAGLLSPAQVRMGMVLSFALATLAGVYLTSVAGWIIVAVGIASIASGIAYTGGPFPLGYNGLGDAFVFVFFGLVAVCGTVFVTTGTVPPLAIAASVPIGALATAVLVVNNVRDVDTDAVAGKRTIVVLLGRRFGLAEYAALMALAYLVPVALVLGHARSPWVLLPLVTLPFAIGLVKRVVIGARERHGSALNACLIATAKLLLAYGALFALGLVLG